MSPDFICKPVFRNNGKRVQNLVIRNGAYYLRATVAGKRFLRASPYADLGKSEKWALNMIAKAKERRGDSLAETKAHSEFITLDAFLEIYLAAAAEQFALDGKPAPRTAKRNTTNLLHLVRTVRNTENPGALRLDVLTPELLEDYTKAKVREAAAGGDELEIQRARISTAATVRFAKSLFARWTEAPYRRAKLLMPPRVAQFLRTGKSFRPPAYQPRPPELVAKTHEEAAKLAQAQPDLYAAYLLCYRFGLRASEASQARWDWIETDAAGNRAIRICRRTDWKGPKNTTDHAVPAQADTWTALEAVRSESPFILPGPTHNARYALVTKDLATWMRGIGWGAQYSKKAHELRKLAGCVWLQSAGPAWASKWLGDNLSTVLHYYAAIMGTGQAVKM
jgi:integrase